MYVISCRRGFDSDQRLAAKNAYRNFTNPTDAGAFEDLTKTELLQRATNKHVCILVHGFNNELPEVMNAYWKITSQMVDTGVTGASGYGLVIGFTWPGFATAAGFFTAVINAKKAAPFLLESINDLRRVAHTVDIQTHSLGARVALTALRSPNNVFVDNLLLSAAAVDSDLLEPDKDFFSSTLNCNRLFVYHTKQDGVLRAAYPLGDLQDGPGRALGLRGPHSKPLTVAKTPNVYVVDCAQRVTHHGGYKDTRQYFQHWNQVLSGASLPRYDELA
jgi:esterase/lipase superfamily enzyme